MLADSVNLFIVIGKQLYYGNQHHFTKLFYPADEIAPLAANKIFIKSDTVLYFYDNGVVKEMETGLPLWRGTAAVDLWKTEAGSIWLNSHYGLYRYENGTWRLKIQNSGGRALVFHLIENKYGRGFASISSPFINGLWSWDKNSLPRRVNSQKGDWIRSMSLLSSDEALAVYGSGSIIQFHNGRWQDVFPLPQEMENAEVLKFRTNGDLWIGSEEGLFLFNAHVQMWTYLKQKDLMKNRVNEILRTADGSLWTGTSEGVSIYSPGGTVTTINRIGNIPVTEITGLAQDRDGNIWISSGFSFNGAFKWDGKHWTYVNIGQECRWARFHKIRKDMSGNLWFLGLGESMTDPDSTGPGAWMYDGSHFVRWSTKNGLTSNRVYSFAEGHDGSYWFGTKGALSHWKNGAWTHWYGDKGEHVLFVFSVAVDDSDNVWFSDRMTGIHRMDKNGFVTRFDEKSGLPNNIVWDIRSDSLQRIWITTNGGVCRYARRNWTTFGPQTGLTTPYIWPIFPEGNRIWVGTSGEGLAFLDLDKCIFSSISMNLETPLVENKTANFHWHPYAEWGLPSSEKILTRYRIDDNDWSEWSVQHVVTVTDISSGEHSFQIQAKNLYGQFAKEGWKQSVYILHPLYMRSVFIYPVGALIVILCVMSVVLIRRKRKYDIEVRQKEVKFRRLTEATFEGILLHKDGMIIDVNQSLLDLFGYLPEEVIGSSLLNLVAKENQAFVEEHIQSATYEGLFQARFIKKNREEIIAEVNIKPLPTDTSSVSVLAIRDITEKKNAESRLLQYQDQLRAMTLEISQTEERERRRIAAFLHDYIGQTLAMCKLKLPAAELNEIDRLLSIAIEYTKSITFELSPPVLRELSFPEAIEWLVAQIQDHSNILIYFADDGRPKPLSENTRYFLYHAIRELLLNVVKHAKTHSAEVSLSIENDTLMCVISDDGAGMDANVHAVSNKYKNGNFGLFNLRERIVSMGGAMSIQSAENKGTTITLSLPMKPEYNSGNTR